MTDLAPISTTNCSICGSANFRSYDRQFLFFPNKPSHLPKVKNYICKSCGVVFVSPQPSDNELQKHYNGDYRKNQEVFHYKGTCIQPLIQFPASINSFLRSKNFFFCLERLEKQQKVKTKQIKKILDLGGYQGMFLSALSQGLDFDGSVVDFNERGIEFAKNAFGFVDSYVLQDGSLPVSATKVNLVTMVHSLEHMRNCVKTLKHLKKNVISKNGYLYIEVPNVFASPMNDPTHFYSFSMVSLRNLLEISGYEVLEMFLAGNPNVPLLLDTEELVIVCMAKPKSGVAEIEFREVGDISEDLNRSYRRLSKQALWRVFRDLRLNTLKMIYYTLVVFGLETWGCNSINIVNRIKNFTTIKFH